MRELNKTELDAVSGGLNDLVEAGAIIVGLGAMLTPVGWAAFTVALGTTLIWGGAFAGS